MSSAQDLLLFEDPGYRRLLPLAYTRPVYELRCGAHTLAEKVMREFPGWRVSFQCRDYVQRPLAESDPAWRTFEPRTPRILLVNGRLLLDEVLARRIREAPGEVVYRAGGSVAAAWISRSRWPEFAGQLGVAIPEEPFAGLPEEEAMARFIQYPWDLFGENEKEIAVDLGRSGLLGRHGADLSRGAYIENPQSVALGRARVDAGAVLDARRGPILVGDGAVIGANAVIEGPAVVGERCLVKPRSFFTGGVTLGPQCRVGGEVSTSVFQGYSNKQHDGFVGHSYLGAWTNLGAGTDTSDLKNNYRPVRVRVDGQDVDSGSLHVGLVMGDHSKSAIGSRFATGAVVGVCCNYFAPGLSPRAVPSFAWVGPDGAVEYELESALATARTVLGRRELALGVSYEAMLRTVFELTEGERAGLASPAGQPAPR